MVDKLPAPSGMDCRPMAEPLLSEAAADHEGTCWDAMESLDTAVDGATVEVPDLAADELGKLVPAADKESIRIDAATLLHGGFADHASPLLHRDNSCGSAGLTADAGANSEFSCACSESGLAETKAMPLVALLKATLSARGAVSPALVYIELLPNSTWHVGQVQCSLSSEEAR